MAARAMCPLCTSDEDLEITVRHDDGRREVRCPRCDFSWPDAQAEPSSPTKATRATPRTGSSIPELRDRLPKASDVDAATRERVERLKVDLAGTYPVFDERVAAFWAHYQQVFSEEGLWACDPQDLKDFANDPTGAEPGNMSGFNIAWNTMGADAAAESTRRTIHHLLHGPRETHLEDRLNELLEGEKAFAMRGFKEALLTKVLCVMYPERFLTLLTYTSPRDGKREIARKVYGLELPPPDRVSWTRGRLITWSNDILRELVGDGFTNQQHAAEFLWRAKDHQGDRHD
ncbi:MAG: hypothetical protein WA966_15045 [Ornithinimicrobium sp.]